MEIRIRPDDDEVTGMKKKKKIRMEGGAERTPMGRRAEGQAARNTYHLSLWVGGQDQFSQSL